MKDLSNKMKLKMLGLPAMEDLDDFSLCTHLSKKAIWTLSRFSDNFYFEYTISKDNGTYRTISQPSKELKALQAWVLRNILDRLQSSPSCKGFEKKTTILDNALPHIGCSIVLSVDIEDFFPSITANKVYAVFYTIGYNSLVSSILTNICTHKKTLPQGSPCSPKLSNLICIRKDNRIQGYVGKRGITYTRYADDMAFSGLSPQKVIRIIPTLTKIIADEGFNLNPNKTRVAGLARAKRVTGLIVNEKEAGIGAQKFKTLRAKIHHLTYEKEKNNIELLNEVRGWLAFLNSVDKKQFNRAKKYIVELKGLPIHKSRLIQNLVLE